jgi:serine/threonine-protein kinase HipA
LSNALNYAQRPDVVFDIFLHRDHIGFLCSKGVTSWFVFDADYKDNPGRQVLGLRFEEDLNRLEYGNDRLPAWFSNLLPEGQLRRLFARAAGVSEDGRFYLSQEQTVLGRVGLDLPGAVQVVPSEVDQYLSGKPVAHPPDQPDLGDATAELRTDSLRFSVAGVAMKLSMLQTGDRFTAPASGIGGKWLIKLPDPLFADLPLNEFSMMTLAKRIGLDVPKIMLPHRDEVKDVPDHLWGKENYAFAIERFDRTPSGSKVHIEDFAQVRGKFPENKYTGTFETLGALIFRNHDQVSLVEFTRRLAFNILIGNGDAHLKNWSLIYREPQKPSLSPAYDIVSVAPYHKQGIDLDLGLRLGRGKRFDQVSLEAFERLGRKLGTAIDLKDVAYEVVKDVNDAWPEVAELLGQSEDVRKSTSEHLDIMTKTFLGK